jgi:RHS repeat-associated protein
MGYRPAIPAFGVPLADTLVWRSRWMDPTGYYQLGARPYDPVAGHFLSADPLGHESSMDLYSFCNGDPLNGFDPTGYFTKGLWAGANDSGVPGNSSVAFMAGYTSGGVGGAFAQGVGEGAAIDANTFTAGQIDSLNSYTGSLQGEAYDAARDLSYVALAAGGMAAADAALAAYGESAAAGLSQLYDSASYVAGVASSSAWTPVGLGAAINGYLAYQDGAGPEGIAVAAVSGGAMGYAAQPFAFGGEGAPAPEEPPVEFNVQPEQEQWIPQLQQQNQTGQSAAEGLPQLEISASKYPDLAENILNAQQAGNPSVLTAGGDIAANRASALEGVPNIPGLSRDEYPFASSMEGGQGAWVGHIPVSQQNAQGALIKNFINANNITPGMQYKVVIVP